MIEWSLKNRFMVILATLFVIAAGIYSITTIPLDAIPDLSDVQVIIYTEYPGQAPRVVEDQITYPITTQMLAVPYAKVVRGYSFFGFSFVYVIFEDGTDMYWARSRVLEYLNYVSGRLPKGVTPSLGPDATGVGWAFMYALTSDQRDLSQLRSIQDWYLKYELTSVEGVSEVASIGGFTKQYQVTVDPVKLLAYNLPLSKIKNAIQRSNNDVGGRVIEMSEKEFMVRGLGYIQNVDDLKKVVVDVDMNGTPVLVQDVANVGIGPDIRRGIAEWNGEGETVGGIVIIRYGANALDVIKNVKEKLASLKEGLPPDVEIHVAYDRSDLIERAIHNLREKLTEEMIIVAIVCGIFLFHLRSSLVAIFTLPVAILISFIIMRQQGINSNIMSLGGIAIAIGAMVDAAIVMIENAHKHIERDGGEKPHWDIIRDASVEVGPTLFYSLLVITLSFLPIFALQAQEGRLFKPLAFTKTYAMGASSLLAITLVPVLMGYWIRGKIHPEERHPVSRFLIWLYSPLLHFVLKYRKLVLFAAIAIMALTIIPYKLIGREFMPPLYEGDLLYMPTTLPSISTTKAREILQQTDKIIKQFPEVENVFGKIGRADTATDPAPLSMIETTITLKPESEWRPGMNPEKLISELDAAIQFPGVTNAWTMPIKTRIDMLSTGIKTPVGIKIGGPDLRTLEEVGREVEAVVRQVPGTLSAYSERVFGGNYLNFKINRDEISRYGLTVGDVQDVLQSAVGGMNISTTIEGLERYPINLRYSRELRDDVESLKRVLVPTPMGQQIPLAQLADIYFEKAAPSIKTENSRPNAWIYVDIKDIDVGTYVDMARRAVAEKVEIPAGYTITWSGQYEYMQRAQQRLMVVVPMTILIIFVVLYLNTKSVTKTIIVFLAVPFSLVGAIWLIYILGFNFSIAVWVGILALAGLDAETGVVMLLYLDLAQAKWTGEKRMNTTGDLKEAIYHGAVKRIRPKMMTVTTTIVGLLPIMWGTGSGSDVMKRIAAPMVGGLVTSLLLELTIYPIIYYIWKSRSLKKGDPTTW
ncbi:MAG: efflux RND transporter permease subunit [Candidatus Abyssobacteria bacterium SURF_5]|uniref:Efflux RND transporter permease subunit n=1 Tax=Abyssobacteria bacterium (strain SURF_5) TaxID=2093360 RepID=A0A3A4NPY7_ABYX5|nr:MAG: efflux RND transporter permease subunit [Candidatus Abyssubacteria bacterium SURF_5]